MTAEPHVLSTVDSRGVATVTLNRPDKANSYDAAMQERLAVEFERHGADATVRVIVLRGAGRHFSAGADVVAGAEPPSGRRDIVEICALMDGVPKPTLAVVQGACVGGGMALAACCDILLASPSAFFSLPEVRLGMSPGALGVVFASALGLRHFRRLAMSGERFDAGEALRIGFAHAVAEPGELERRVAAQLDEILMAAPNAAVNAKMLALRLAGKPDAATLAAAQAEFAQSRASDEAREGRESFREKRKPRWYPAS